MEEQHGDKIGHVMAGLQVVADCCPLGKNGLVAALHQYDTTSRIQYGTVQSVQLSSARYCLVQLSTIQLSTTVQYSTLGYSPG